ncbi:NTP transferase domain-containing protein [Azospirillum halopraeferens]|uniref:NTP transferase domain-containing protein n=1 Tax=Azospirillum halopraeferens TaxID=34010 RepID=UPI0003FEFD8C|nr:NTP transferase domain-containing protein [Azospirillum halopraeferens]
MAAPDPSPIVLVPVLAGGRTDRLLEPLAGRSSLERTLAAAVEELPGATVAVTTDADEVKAAARAFGRGVVVHDRTVHDYVPALLAAMNDLRPDAAVVAVLEATHPFRPRGLVGRTVENLRARPHLDSVVCVRQFKANLWHLDADDTITALSPGGDHRDRTYYQEMVGLGLATRPHLLRHGRRLGDSVGFEVVDRFWGLVDIRDSVSLAVARVIAGELESLEDSIQ